MALLQDIRRYGRNGVFASQPVYFADGPSGYFGSQVDGDATAGGLLFSIWDKARSKADSCADPGASPNATWCAHKHSFPLSANCHRHCLDCGLHPGWHNTTGTQCGTALSINEGDSFMFRMFQSATNATLKDPVGMGLSYAGSEWTLTATQTSAATGATAVHEVRLQRATHSTSAFGQPCACWSL